MSVFPIHTNMSVSPLLYVRLTLCAELMEARLPETTFMGEVDQQQALWGQVDGAEMNLFFRPSDCLSPDAGREALRSRHLGAQEAGFSFLCFVIVRCDLIVSGAFCEGNLWELVLVSIR